MSLELKVNWVLAKGEHQVDEVTEAYIFYEQIKTIERLLAENSREAKNYSNKVISVCGERGSGKSSFVRTLSNDLKKQGEYYVLNKIDPTVFDSSLSILELFISEIFNETNKERQKSKDEDLRDKINREIKDIMGILKNIRKEKSGFADTHPSVEVLLSINAQTNLDKNLIKLIDLFEEFVTKKGNKQLKLVMLIDDLDLINNEKAYQVLEDINKYLANKVAIVIAYREEQLLQTILDTKVKENKNLLDCRFLDEKLISESELMEQSVAYIEKLFPKSQRVFLDISENRTITAYDLIEVMIENQDGEYEDLKLPLDQFIKIELFKRTKITIEPIDLREKTAFIYPTTLRSALQYLEFIFSLKNIDSITEPKLKVHILIKNISLYKSFILNKMNEELSMDYYSIIKSWVSATTESKNHYAASAVINKCDKAELEPHVQIISSRQHYNVAVGDVFSAFEGFKQQKIGKIDGMHFIYSFKLLYSITLLQEYLILIKKELEEGLHLENEKDTGYEILLNGKIMPNKFYYAPGVISNDEETTIVMNDSFESPESSTLILLDKLIFSNIPAKGEVKSHGYESISNMYDSKSVYQYRYFYNYKDLTLQDGLNYGIDPFSFLAKRVYLKKTIENQKKILHSSQDESTKSSYVFYSFFDLDIFIRKNYARNSQEDILTYVLKRVNDIFENTNKVSEDSFFINQLTPPLFINSNLISGVRFKYPNVFDEQDIEILKGQRIIEIAIKSWSKSKMIDVYEKILRYNDYNNFFNLDILKKLDKNRVHLIQTGSRVRNSDREFILYILKEYNLNITQDGEIIEND